MLHHAIIEIALNKGDPLLNNNVLQNAAFSTASWSWAQGTGSYLKLRHQHMSKTMTELGNPSPAKIGVAGESNTPSPSPKMGGGEMLMGQTIRPPRGRNQSEIRRMLPIDPMSKEATDRPAIMCKRKMVVERHDS